MNGVGFRLGALPRTASMLLVAACSPLPPLDFDGKPVQAPVLVALFDGGVLAVQTRDASARVIVELAVEERRGTAVEVNLRVGNAPLLWPSRWHRDQPDCDASVRRDRGWRVRSETDGAPAVVTAMPCLTTFRAEFLLARPPTISDSLFVVTRDGRARLATWYRP